MFAGDPVEVKTFDQSANAVYQHILAHGFWERFFAA